jgi:uncharacterized membrane-anchored protein YitT (DUF2179 family)
LTIFLYGSGVLHYLFLIIALVRKSKTKYHGSLGYFLLLISNIFGLGVIIPLQLYSNETIYTVLMVILMASTIFYYFRHTEELKEEAIGNGEKNENKA